VRAGRDPEAAHQLVVTAAYAHLDRWVPLGRASHV
jgi:hypothetical protein